MSTTTLPRRRWRLVDLDQRLPDLLEGIDIVSDPYGDDYRVSVVQFGSVIEAAVATGGCHIDPDGTVVTLRVDNRLYDPVAHHIEGNWLVGTGPVR